MNKENPIFPKADHEHLSFKKKKTPGQTDAWVKFSKEVFKDGALDEKTKELIATAVGHATQCPYCIKAHTKRAMKKGANKEEIMEAIWIATELKAGAAYAHSAIAIEEMEN